MTPDAPRRILIVGGVAGGASCAARLRRLCERATITVFDRGPYVSFANCGLPYYVGDVISDERKLLLASRDSFRERFNIQVCTETEALAIDRGARTLQVRDLRSGALRSEPYDVLVLAPGAAPIRPALPGMDLPGVFAVRTIPDSRRIREWLTRREARRAVVVGGGFIGLEMVENLKHRGLQVTLLEKLPQVMPPLDAEMAAPLLAHLRAQGVTARLGDGLAGIAAAGEALEVQAESGARLPADLVILALGVRPETALAREAGLPLGARGGIVVDAGMRTADPHVFALGDAVEVHDVLTGQEVILPLAGPANRQGRIAAESIMGLPSRFRGVQATAVVGVLGMTAASTGASEKGLRRAGIADFEKIYLHPGHHAGYYPGARPIHLKLLFARGSGKILGAQAVGTEGVEKRIDVIATAIQFGATVRDLAQVELCYAPQFGAAKDPVNLAGMVACNVLDGAMPLADWEALLDREARSAAVADREARSAAVVVDREARSAAVVVDREARSAAVVVDREARSAAVADREARSAAVADREAQVVDVREAEEFAAGHIPGALHLPLSQLRQRYQELPRDRELWLCCGVGQRAYYAARFLMQHGFTVRHLSGGYLTYQALAAARAEAPPPG